MLVKTGLNVSKVTAWWYFFEECTSTGLLVFRRKSIGALALISRQGCQNWLQRAQRSFSERSFSSENFLLFSFWTLKKFVSGFWLNFCDGIFKTAVSVSRLIYLGKVFLLKKSNSIVVCGSWGITWSFVGRFLAWSSKKSILLVHGINLSGIFCEQFSAL